MPMLGRKIALFSSLVATAFVPPAFASALSVKSTPLSYGCAPPCVDVTNRPDEGCLCPANYD
ncbi:hypothetical protein, partial [Sphingomonas sp.]|uniref:hypothetical protein n=1 Tax=Sphingomonas sp. TaxID=28214 RepID=UPI002DBB1718